MSTKASKELCFCPETKNSNPSKKTQNGSGTNDAGICGFRVPRSQKSMEPVKVLRQLKERLKALRLMYKREQRSSSKISSSATLARSRSWATATAPDRFDSQRAEAVEDCIEFLNSSSSLRRSTSVSSCA
ncbi:hypothetical protein Ancab_015284 [Ancistrocladus abbreviatus]